MLPPLQPHNLMNAGDHFQRREHGLVARQLLKGTGNHEVEEIMLVELDGCGDDVGQLFSGGGVL